MSFIADIFKQHQIDATQNNSTAANAQDAYNKNIIDLYNAVNTDKTNLFNANTAAMTAKNDIATKNPSTFAKQAALAGILGNTPTVNGPSALNYTGIGDTAKGALAELQRQAINNLMASPSDNPIPKGGENKAPDLVNAPTVRQFAFDNYGGNAWSPVSGGAPGTAVSRTGGDDDTTPIRRGRER